MRTSLFPLGVGAAVLASALAGAAFGQSNPSAEQIIDSLKPTGTVSSTTRGIEMLPTTSDTAAPANPPVSQPAPAPVQSAAPLAQTNLDIVFDPGSATLTPEATAELDQLGEALTSSTLSSYSFKIIGHTDTTGDPATNQALSEARAQATKSYLESKFNIPDGRLQAEGVGESDLLVPTPPQTPELRNRRVQIVNIGQ